MVATLHAISAPVVLSDDAQSPLPSKEVQETSAETIATPPRQQSQADIKSELETESPSPTPEGSIASSRVGGSENGVETEEDEGMVLVDRPERK